MIDALHPVEPSTPSVEYVGFRMRFAATRKLVLRYFAYFVSIGIDRKKQGFHDKIAGTLVVKDKEKS